MGFFHNLVQAAADAITAVGHALGHAVDAIAGAAKKAGQAFSRLIHGVVAACKNLVNRRPPPGPKLKGPGTVGDHDRAAKFFPGKQKGKDTCALMATEGVLHQKTGKTHTEAEMKKIGTASGEYKECNGTIDQAKVMTQAGIPSTYYTKPTLKEIAQQVNQGKAVIVGLDARPLWGKTGPKPLGHAVRVTGVELDKKGNPVAFYINDTGTGKANQKVSAKDMKKSLDGLGGGDMGVSNDPVH